MQKPVDYRAYITIDPNISFGKPCIKGTRFTVYDVLDYMAGGMTVEDLLEDFPYLTREGIQAALAFAAEFKRLYPYHVRTTDFSR